MDFENDIFISYAHIDNESLTEAQKGWISVFHRALEVRLGQLLGKKPRIFRDPKLQGNDVFSDRLLQSLPKTATLVSIMTPRYVRSEWCRKELYGFIRSADATIGVSLGTKSRIFKVVKTPIPVEQHPDEVRELLGYEFFSIDPETGRPHELGQDTAPEEQRVYWARLNDLAYDLCELLTLLESAVAGGAAVSVRTGPAAKAVGAEEGETVYLAETSHDLRDERDALARFLEQHGHTVLPGRNLPLVAAECEELVGRLLPQCRMSIHLVGASYGVVPEGTTRSLLALQHDAAVAHGAADARFQRLIWMPPELDPEDERLRELVGELRTDPRSQEGADLLETPIADLRLAILELLATSPGPDEPETPADEGAGAATVYLVCDERDLDAVGPLEDFLFERGYEVVLPLFDGDETEIREEHEECLRSCAAVLVYYGAGNEAWQRRMTREVRKSAGYGRSGPPPPAAIYVAAPETAQKQRLRTREALVLRQQGAAFAPEDLEPLLSMLPGDGGG